MRPRASSMRSARRSGSWWFAGTFVVLVLAAVGTTLWAAGWFDRSVTSPSRAGMVAFPVPSKPIPAYTAITREYLENPQTRELSLLWVYEDQTSPAMLRDLGQILGRVVGRDRAPGLVFTEADFLPKGTRPGITAGIPPGKRSLTVSADQIRGLEHLRRGDHFDLFAALPSRNPAAPIEGIEVARLLGGIKPPDTRGGQLSRQTGVKLLVSDGTMVALTNGTQTSTQGRQGLVVSPPGRSTKVAVTEATLAVDPDEVSPLTEALGLDVKVFCVARSGQPSAESDELATASLDGLSPVLATIRPIPAYASITAEDLADAVSGKLNLYYFPPSAIQAGWLQDASSLLGRVVRRAVAPGEILTEQDLLPVGSLAGISSAIPEGKVGVSAAVTAIEGFSQLHAGAVLDLVSPVEGQSFELLPQVDWATLHGGQLSPDEDELQAQVRNGVRMVARRAIKLPAPSEGDAILAVTPAEATSVMQILQQRGKLFAIAHGVQPMPVGPTTDAAEHQPLQRVAYQVEQPGAGGLPFPVLTKPVRSGERLTIDHFLDPATGRVRHYYFPADELEADWVADARELIDRVAAKDLQSGYVIREDDLLPAGSRPSRMAGVLPGEVAFTITSEQIEGLSQLQAQDRVLLVSAAPIPVDGPARQVLRGENLGEQLAGTAALDQSLIDRVVANGTVVYINQREVKVPYESRIVSEGAWGREIRTEIQFQNQEQHEVVLSLAANEIAPLSAALAGGKKLFAVARSANAADQSLPPELPSARQALQDYVSIEHLRGGQRSRELWKKDVTAKARTAEPPQPQE